MEDSHHASKSKQSEGESSGMRTGNCRLGLQKRNRLLIDGLAFMQLK